MAKLLDITLPIELLNKNDGQGRHWITTHRTRKQLLRDLVTLGQRRTPFEQPVSVVVTRILGKKQRYWDSSSVLRGNYKQLEDALVECGWFHDDSWKYIRKTIGEQDGSQRANGPATRIEVWGFDG